MKIKNVNFESRKCSVKLFDVYREDIGRDGVVVEFDIDNIELIKHEVLCYDDVLTIIYKNGLKLVFDMLGDIRSDYASKNAIDFSKEFKSFYEFLESYGVKKQYE